MGQVLMQIGEVAERTGLSLRTIRFYEEAKLVEPAERSPGGFRLYSEAEVDRLEQVMQMKPLGFSVEDMARFLSARDELAIPGLAQDRRGELAETMSAFADDARKRVAKLERTVRVGHAFVAALTKIEQSSQASR